MCRVSIHAPARGATRRGITVSLPRLFQSTPPRGGRRSSFSHSNRSTLFQSTPPRGGRRKWLRRHRDRCISFNPRPRAGGDLRGRHMVMGGGVSIHAPARGATHSASGQHHVRYCFNPRPRAGGDQCRIRGRTSRPVSIHAPARGATAVKQSTFNVWGFQSTPPRGGRRASGFSISAASRFQSTPPRGGRLRTCRGYDDSRQFQSTPPRGGRLDFASGSIRVLVTFQSTPPRGGRQR